MMVDASLYPMVYACCLGCKKAIEPVSFYDFVCRLQASHNVKRHSIVVLCEECQRKKVGI